MLLLLYTRNLGGACSLATLLNTSVSNHTTLGSVLWFEGIHPMLR
jgi:hypothetical protein